MQENKIKDTLKNIAIEISFDVNSEPADRMPEGTSISAKLKELRTTLVLTPNQFLIDEPNHAQKTPINPLNFIWR